MVIVDVVVSFGCVFMALFGSYFAYEDYQESEYDEGDVDSASSSDPRRYVPGDAKITGVAREKFTRKNFVNWSAIMGKNWFF